MSARRKWKVGLGVVVVLLAGAGVTAALFRAGAPGQGFPTARVVRGELTLRVYTTGELRPTANAMLVAPPVGGTLQIVKLAPTGTLVHAGDVVAEFDPGEQEYQLDQARSTLEQAQQQIVSSKANTAVQAAQDQVALLKARFAVRSAELDVSKNELVSAIDAKKNLLTLEEAKRSLEQLEQDVRSRAASNQAQLAVYEEQRNKAQLDMTIAQKRIDSMVMKAPISGLVSVRQNQAAAGGFFFTGMVLPEFHEGDQVSPGSFFAQVLAVDQMDIQAKLPETVRGDVNAGQAVEIRVDSLPGTPYAGKVKSVAGMATSNFWDDDPTRRFDASFSVDHPDARLRPGLTAQVTILGEQLHDALYVPRQALFESAGKTVVYVRQGSGFEPREVKIKHRTESQAVIEGVSEGTEIALVNPTQTQRKSSSPAAPAVGGGGQ